MCQRTYEEQVEVVRAREVEKMYSGCCGKPAGIDKRTGNLRKSRAHVKPAARAVFRVARSISCISGASARDESRTATKTK